MNRKTGIGFQFEKEHRLFCCRYRAIITPLHEKMSKTTAKIIITFIWASSILVKKICTILKKLYFSLFVVHSLLKLILFSFLVITLQTAFEQTLSKSTPPPTGVRNRVNCASCICVSSKLIFQIQKA